jgi:hypothetical protein
MPTKKVEAEIAPKRRILVFQDKKSFVITVPEDAKTTFGPWVPPGMRSTDMYGRSHGGAGDSVGTLRVYGRTEKHILGVFSGVTGFRDLSLEYVEVESDMLGGVEEEPEEAEPTSADSIFFTSDGLSYPLPASAKFKKPRAKELIDFSPVKVPKGASVEVVDPDEEDSPF